jgi:hypothetical protein
MTINSSQDIKRGIVAILSMSGKRKIGTGFLIGDIGYIATCAHVIKQVLGQIPETKRTVQIRFAANGLVASAV